MLAVRKGLSDLCWCHHTTLKVLISFVGDASVLHSADSGGAAGPGCDESAGAVRESERGEWRAGQCESWALIELVAGLGARSVQLLDAPVSDLSADAV